MASEPSHPVRPGKAFAFWLLALLALNAALLTIGLTEDAITISKKLTKVILGLEIRMVDERSTYSIITAIYKLWDDGNHGLFAIVFGFSIVFPIGKLLVNSFLVLSTFHPRTETRYHPKIAAWLGYLGKWSMIEVFMAALLCVFVKLGDLVRVQLEPGLYVFCAAVFASIVCALATKRYCTIHHPSSAKNQA